MAPSDYMRQLAETAVNTATEPIDDMITALKKARLNGHKVMICGNGGSAATADHFTLDLQKNAGLCCVSLNSNASITAYANDFDYTEIYKKQLEAIAHPHDILICTSTSGNSPNIIKAAEYARSILMTVITLTALSGGQLLTMGDIDIYIPTDNIGIAEDLHAAVLHSVIEGMRE